MNTMRVSLKSILASGFFAVILALGGWLVAHQETSQNLFNFFGTREAGAYGSSYGYGSYGYNQPNCSYQGVCLTYGILDYSEIHNAWRARIDFNLPEGVRGILRKNGYDYTTGLFGNSFIYTNYELYPGQTYEFDLFTKAYYESHYNLVSIVITAPLVPVNPGYGYKLPIINYGSYAAEGWIETTASGNNAWVSGWAYDNGSEVSVTFNMQNVNTGVISSIGTSTYSFRSDVKNYLSQKYGISSSDVPVGFVVDLSLLPAGTYRIATANFNGKNFYVHGQANSIVEVTNITPLVLTSPNGGESWKIGSYQTIRWSGGNVSSEAYKLYLQRSTDSLDLYLGTVTGQNEFAWRVAYGYYFPNTPVDSRNDYRIVVRGSGGNYDISDNAFSIISTETARVGQIVIKNGTVYLVGENGLYLFPDFSTFNSWGFSFADLVQANSAELALNQVGVVPTKMIGCSSPINQIKGLCNKPVDPKPLTLEPVVTHMYTCILPKAGQQRIPSADEVDYWVNYFNTNKTSVSAIYATFFDSPEYKLKSTSNSEYVRDLYKCVLFRTPSESEVAFQAGALSSITREALRMNLLRSSEFQLVRQNKLAPLIDRNLE